VGGILFKSTTKVSLEIVLSAIGSSIQLPETWLNQSLFMEWLDFVRNFDSYCSFSRIGAIIRIPNAERDKAISSSNS
jgi:hypothetical protein